MLVSPFLRAIESLDELKEKGTSEVFFSGPEYLLLPSFAIDVIRNFSLGRLSSVELSKTPESAVDSLAPFFLRLAVDSENAALSELTDLLSREILNAVKLASKRICESTPPLDSDKSPQISSGRKSKDTSIMIRDLDDEFDVLRAACDLRDYLLHLNDFARRQKKIGNLSAALLIEA